jgi:hypothetical protein
MESRPVWRAGQYGGQASMEGSPIRRGGQYGLQTSTEGGRVWGADD